ncbi:MAG: penicillin-binding protein 2 [Bacteroidales bacterium]|nr:penicillin-binding protein 2 [Bacteroidales bacterium]
MVIALFIITGFIFLARLFFIQVVDDSYFLSAESNVLRKVTVYPNRGIIYDRNNTLLCYDEAAYDIMVVPGQVKDIDTADFCGLLGISDSLFDARIRKAKKYSNYKPSLFLAQITKDEFGYIQEQLFKYPGFYAQPRSLRTYPLSIAAHTLGYVGEVNENDLKSDSYYRLGDYIGKSGIEKEYEKDLRGKKGVKIVMVDVHNREQGSYRDGRYDSAAFQGTVLHLTIDAGLQEYAESLMQNKMGSVVALDPKTGGILAFVTSPTYDPNFLVGRVRGKNFMELMHDSLKPLMNRAIMGTYPPGSTFKIVNALIGLQENVLYEGTYYSCYGPATTPIRCTHNHYSPLELKEAIEQSCNPYFWNVFKSIINQSKYNSKKAAYNVWRDHVISLGFGNKFDTDIPFELSGNIPSAEYYDKIYGEKRWNALTIRSLAIGQGEILATPLQLANLAAIIANKGFYYPPHLMSQTGRNKSGLTNFQDKQITSIQPSNFNVVQDAMLDVFEGAHGTARWAKLPGVEICGKTGTVQNPHGKDHSIFIAFAPRQNPKIAMSVIVENSGYGSTWAAPIASLLAEMFLFDSISRPLIETRILEGNLITGQ